MFSQRIAVDSTFDFVATVESHGWYQLAPFDYHREHGVLSRVQQLADGRLVLMHIEPRDDELLVETEGDVNATDQGEIEALVRHMLCLDWQLDGFYTLTNVVPGYQWVALHGAGRLLRSPSIWEDLAKILLTTNTTWKQTVEMVKKLVTLGEKSDFGYAFPTPEQIAPMDVASLTAHVGAGYRGVFLHNVARQIVIEEIEVESWHRLDNDDLYQQITSLKGFGDYAASSIMRLLGHHDRLGIDSVARSMFAHMHNGGDKAEDATIEAHYAGYGSWRGLMMWMDVIRANTSTN